MARANNVIQLKTLPRFRVRVNPASGAPAAARGKKSSGRNNPGEIVRASLARLNAAGGKAKHTMSANPKGKKKKKGGGGMVAQIKRLLAQRRNPAGGKKTCKPSAARKNNVVSIATVKRMLGAAKKKGKGRGLRGNPIIGRKGATGLFYLAGLAIGGAVATRVVTQAVLGNKNEGVLGYVGNFAAAIGVGMAAGAVLGAQSTLWVTFGGILGLTLRLLQDLTPLGRSLSLSGLGDYVVATYFEPRNIMPGTAAMIRVPQQLQQQPFVAVPAAPVVSASAAGMAGRRGVGCYGPPRGPFGYAAAA